MFKFCWAVTYYLVGVMFYVGWFYYEEWGFSMGDYSQLMFWGIVIVGLFPLIAVVVLAMWWMVLDMCGFLSRK